MASPSKTTLLVGALAALLVVAGIAGALVASDVVTVTGGTDDTDPAAIADRVEATLNETQAFEARLVQTQRVGDNETMRMEAIVAYEAPGKINITYVSPDRFAGTRIVSNGTATMIYNPNTDTVSVRPVNSTAGANASATGLFFGFTSVDGDATVAETERVDDGTVSVSYSTDGKQFSVFLGGAPERRSRLSNTSSPVETTVWIDRDRWLPTKARLNYTNMRTPLVQTIAYENFTRYDDLPEERFRVDPPASARRSEGLTTPFMSENMTTYLSRSAMVDAVDEPVPDPELPANLSFRRGMTLGNGTLLWTIYHDGGDGIVQVQRLAEPVSVFESNRTVPVGDHTAVLTRAQGQRILQWQCGNATYVVYGSMSVFDRQQLVDIAESIACR